MTPVVVVWRALERESAVVAVGHDEQAFARVRCADVGRAEQIPFRSEPALGQIAENAGQSASGNKGRHVFQQHEPRSHFVNAGAELGPDPALIADPGPIARRAPRLAREPRCDAIHEATPASAVEGGHVVPDRRDVHGARVHARDQLRGGKGFPFHVTDGTVTGHDKADGEFQSANPGT